MYEWLPERLGLSRDELVKIENESILIPVNKEEIRLVNRYTCIHAKYLFAKEKPDVLYKSYKFRMIKGKASDYRFFVRMYEKYEGLPRGVYEYLNSYPFCGAVKIMALKKRFGEIKIVQECTYQTMTYEEFNSKTN